MRVTLEQNEIEQALRDYLASNGFVADDRQVTIAFTQRRLPTAVFSAEIDINPPGVTVEAEPAPAPATSAGPVKRTPRKTAAVTEVPREAPPITAEPPWEEPDMTPEEILRGPAGTALFSEPTPTAEVTEIPPPDANGKVSLFV